MILLQIEHKVPDFDGWKKAFDNDPIGRKKSNVKQHRIYRSVSDPNFVIIDLEFNSVDDANAALAALRLIWGKVEGKLIMGPQARILEIIENTTY